MPIDKFCEGQAEVLPAGPEAITRAAAALCAGGLVALPTETVYGLAARADRAEAVAAIYHAKGRPDFNPLIVHVADLAGAAALAQLDPRARALAAHFWPGPLTLVLPRRGDAALAPAVTAGLPTVAIRCPAHPVMRAILAATGLPLAAPSANRSGGVSPTSAAHVAASLGSAVTLIVDGGACSAGIESSIVALRVTGWQLLRPGPIGGAEITAVIGPPTAGDSRARGAAVEAPGQLASHYCPGKPMQLDVTAPPPGAFHIGFGAIAGDLSLSATGDLAEAAAALYAALHIAAAASQPAITVAPIPLEGLGAAINDRLRRAAAPL